ncbi:hypothetical protein INT48_007084 [Thamnidium elegans]|uniref:Uncharacterized protein n=1 Tax=Thamnidium elegans TaxID=101142 RepID=A0A8H7VU39_9FUNG|nr:hypothetical protein INT48_007084 [Thamnidium elegans]
MVCLKSSSSRIEELEKGLLKTELSLQAFVKEFQSMNDTIVKSPHRVYMLGTDVELARGDKKIADNYIKDLLKDRSKLKTEVSGLSKDFKNLNTIKLSMEKKNAEEKHKIANCNFVTIIKKLRKYIDADFV